MGPEDSIPQELKNIFLKLRLRRMVRMGITLAALVLLYSGCSYTYAAAKIAQAKNQGIYPTAEEAAIRTFGQGFGGARVVSVDITSCGPNNPHDQEAFIWFCTAWVKMDRIPDGYNRSTYLAGDFFVHVRDGWVFMSEGSFPGFIGHVMELYHMEGVQ